MPNRCETTLLCLAGDEVPARIKYDAEDFIKGQPCGWIDLVSVELETTDGRDYVDVTACLSAKEKLRIERIVLALVREEELS